MKSIFVIFAVDKPDVLRSKINTTFPGDFLEVTTGQWIIAAEGSPIEVSEKLEITAGASGGAIVASIANYYGRKNPSIWEWIKSKWGGE